MLGLFTNPVTVILNCDLTDTFRKWLSVVRQHFLAVQAHADLPYELLRSEMHKQNVVMPEIRAILAARTLYRGPLRFGGLEMVPVEGPLTKMPSGFTIAFTEMDEAQRCLAQFDAEKYDPAGVRHLIARFKHLLDAVSRKPDIPINELLGLSVDQLRERDKAERSALLERNRALRG
ncbi:MAG: condensation domain-containing protein, partial [Pseudolabrys sp.]